MTLVYWTLLALLLVLVGWISIVNSRTGEGRWVITPVGLAGFVIAVSILVPSFYLVDVQSGPVLLPIAVAIGFSVGAVMFPRNLATHQAPKVSWDVNRYLRVIPVIFLIMVALSLVRFGGMPPVLEVVGSLAGGEQASDLAGFSSESRRLLTKDGWFTGSSGEIGTALTPLIRIGWPFLASLVLACRLSAEGRLGATRRLLNGYLAAALAATLIFVAGDFVRDRVVWAGMAIVATLTLVRPVRIKSVVGTGLIGLVLVMALTSVSHKSAGAAGVGGIAGTVVGRLDDNYINDLVLYEQIQSGRIEFALGAETTSQMLSSIPGIRVGVPLASRLHYLVTNDADSTTFATMTNVGRLYVDWGLVGVLLGFMGAGLLCSRIQARQLSFVRVTPKGAALSSALVVQSAQLPIVGFVGFLVGALTSVGLWGFAHLLLSDPKAAADRPRFPRIDSVEVR